MIFWKCWFFHKWSKWADQTFEVTVNYMKKSEILVQARTCERCGLQQVKKIGVF